MNPAPDPVPPSQRPWSRPSGKVFVVIGACALVLLLLGALPFLLRPDLEYGFSAPEAWSETCLGGETAARELLDWGDAAAKSPAIGDFEGSFKTYTCEWIWDPDPDRPTGQRLTVTVYVFDDSVRPGYDDLIEQDLHQGEWRIERQSIDGFDHGVCRQDTSGAAISSYECKASDSNLELTVENGAHSTEGRYPSDSFGPGDVPLEDLTAAIGEQVQEAFRR